MRLPALLHRHTDVALGVGAGSVYVAEVLSRGERVGPLLALAPLVVFTLWVRRRAALLALGTCVATWVVSEEIDPAFNQDGGAAWLITWLVAHYALGRWTDGLVAWSAPVVAIATGVTLGWDDVTASGSADLAYFVSISLLPWALGLFVRMRQQHVASLMEDNARLEREQVEAARRAVAEERARIARELHDVVSHAISVTVLQSRGARRKLGHDESAVREALDAIEQTNAAALGDMRRLLAVLRDTEGRDDATSSEPQPSLAGISRLVDEVRASGVSVELALDGEAVDVPPGVDLSAYRIVQEALTNVMKHAGQQATAFVHLVFGQRDLVVCVRDTGGSGGSGGGSGHGLLGIRERVAVVGGEVAAGPVDGGGFEVRARLPYALEVP